MHKRAHMCLIMETVYIQQQKMKIIIQQELSCLNKKRQASKFMLVYCLHSHLTTLLKHFSDFIDSWTDTFCRPASVQFELKMPNIKLASINLLWADKDTHIFLEFDLVLISAFIENW